MNFFSSVFLIVEVIEAVKGPLRARPRSNRRRNRSFGLTDTDTDTDVTDVVGERVEKVGAQLLKFGGFEKKMVKKREKKISI